LESFFKELLDNALVVLKNFYVFKGRSSRKEFWMFVLAAIIGGLALAILSVIPVLGKLFSIILNLYELAIFIVSLSAGTRRLHDVNKSGKLLIPYIIGFIPLVILTFIMLYFRRDPVLLYFYSGWLIFLYVLVGLFGLFAAVIGIILIVFWCRQGDPGENKYGPKPAA